MKVTLTGISVCLFLFMVSGLYGQEQIRLTREIQFEGQNHTTDNLGNIYVSNGPRLVRFNKEGQLTGEFRSVHPGNISFTDASNPLQILLFYKDFNQVVFLDRNLTEKGSPLLLGSLGIENAELVCFSAKGGIWVLDWMGRTLNYFSQDFRLLHQTSLHGKIITEKDTPVMMSENDGNVFVTFPHTGIFTFDRAGAYLSMFQLTGVSVFQKTPDNFVFVKDNKVCIFSPETKETRTIELPLNSYLLSARLEGNLLFAFTSHRILIFKLG